MIAELSSNGNYLKVRPLKKSKRRFWNLRETRLPNADPFNFAATEDKVKGWKAFAYRDTSQTCASHSCR